MKRETDFTAKSIDGQKPDVVMIAVGADPAVPGKINGIDGPNVVFVDEVMAGRAQVGNRVAIWTCSDLCRDTCGVKLAPVEGDPANINSHYSDACRAGYGAVDTAEYLASQGNLVNIVTERENVVPGMGFTSRNYLMKRFYRANVRV